MNYRNLCRDEISRLCEIDRSEKVEQVYYYRKGILELVGICKTKAREKGASKLYVSATPFLNTFDFYMGIGCRPAAGG